jgi:serine/alanine adding enzyme
LSVHIVDTLPEDRWQAFVDGHPQASIFHTPAMSSVFAGARGYRPLLRAAVDDDGRILALLVATEIRLFAGPFARLTSRVVANGSPLCVPGDEGLLALQALLRWHNKTSERRCLFTELRHRDDASALQPAMAQCGYQHEPELNYLIDLRRSPEEIRQSFSRSVRRDLQRAEESGVTAEEVTSGEQVQELYGLLRQVYADAQVPLAHISLFQAVLEQLLPAGMARMVLARCPQGTAGARLALLYKGVIFDWYAGADRPLRDVRPNHFLVWDMLTWGADHGYHTFDFGGAGHPDVPYGVREFKSRFNGRMVNFGRDRCVHTPGLLRLSERAYGLLRRLQRSKNRAGSAEQ